MNWHLIKQLFLYSPYLLAVAALLAFVLREKLSRRARALWAVWLFLCASESAVSYWLCGDVFQPKFTEPLIWAWGCASIGLMYFGGLSLLTFPFRGRWRVWTLPSVAWGVAALGVWNGIRPPVVRELTLEWPDLPAALDGYRLVQVSDLHVSAAARRWRTVRVVETVNALSPDLVCLTGDCVDGKVGERGRDVEPLRGLKARDGLCCVTGNHEYYFSWKDWNDFYRRLGLRFLQNECVFPRPGLAVAGVNDDQVRSQRPQALPGPQPDVRRAFAAATNGEFRILLEHKPVRARENMRACGVRLQLSGHSHGGIMPVMCDIVRRANLGFVRGLYELDGGRLYVSSGAGQCAAFPIRYLTPSEITLFTLKRRKR